jgi:hypothetical protein
MGFPEGASTDITVFVSLRARKSSLIGINGGGGKGPRPSVAPICPSSSSIK